MTALVSVIAQLWHELTKDIAAGQVLAVLAFLMVLNALICCWFCRVLMRKRRD